MAGLLDTIFAQKATLTPQKAVTGSGAAVMTWGTPISDVHRSNQQMMRDAQAVYARGNRWVKRAETVISGRVGSVPWHLETPDGETVTDESPDELRRIRDLFEKPLVSEDFARAYPNQPSTRRTQWGITSRHGGLCNVAFWHLDELDAAAAFPLRILTIRPDRMTPEESGGRLTGWTLDKEAHGGGTSLSVEEVLVFHLDPVDKGYFGTGLVESIFSTVALPSAIDRHAIDTLASGGRLPGIYAPKDTGAGDDVFDRLVSDLRTIKDMPDSSKRDVVARSPIEFHPTAADMSSLVVTALSQMSRDDTLAHWGVPYSTIGGPSATGMNSGESRKYDEAALWQNAVQFRIDMLRETIQFRLLDRLKTIGIELELVIETPSFDDDAPKFELAERSQALPLRNVERRAILGLDPFGDEALDNAIWMPVSVVELAAAPSTSGEVVAEETATTLTPAQADALGALIRAGFEPESAAAAMGLPPISHLGLPPVTVQSASSFLPAEAKASLDRIRDTSTARIKRELAKVLTAMRRDIADRVREKNSLISRKPTDYQVWMPKSKQTEWEKQIAAVLNPHLSLMAESVSASVASKMGKTQKADALMNGRVLKRLMAGVGTRITGILHTTRDEVRDTIEQGIRDGVGAAELGDRIEALGTFSELRAETIARTETGTVLNHAAAESYREYGVTKVRIIDGDEDEVCASANGEEWTLDEFAANPLGHPNCVRDAVPVIGA